MKMNTKASYKRAKRERKRTSKIKKSKFDRMKNNRGGARIVKQMGDQDYIERLKNKIQKRESE